VSQGEPQADLHRWTTLTGWTTTTAFKLMLSWLKKDRRYCYRGLFIITYGSFSLNVLVHCRGKDISRCKLIYTATDRPTLDVYACIPRMPYMCYESWTRVAAPV